MNQNESFTILHLFKNYIYHAKRIHRKSNKLFYRREYRLEAVDRCERYLDAYKFTPHVLHRVIPVIKNDLYAILPISTNSSYQSSLKKLNDLLILCQNLNTKHETRTTSNQCESEY